MIREEVSGGSIQRLLALPPAIKGRSKWIYRFDESRYLIRLIPSLSSFTFNRHELVPGTEILRLDFYEMAAGKLAEAGIPTAFELRVGPDLYVARACSDPPFEVIVKNAAFGSTQRKYPGLFNEGYRFKSPVVKFDFRSNPEDQPVADDYVREAGLDPEPVKGIALRVNRVLQQWLTPRDVVDFCLVMGKSSDDQYVITSEISPDCMRLKGQEGQSLDKDLFRHGATADQIIAVWSGLIGDLRHG